MQESLADYFQTQMERQLAKRSSEGTEAIMMDMRDDGIDFYAVLKQDNPLCFFCRGIRYFKSPEGVYTMQAADGTGLPIDENEYRSRLDYALSCIGASSETGIGVLVKKHIKTL